MHPFSYRQGSILPFLHLYHISTSIYPGLFAPINSKKKKKSFLSVSTDKYINFSLIHFSISLHFSSTHMVSFQGSDKWRYFQEELQLLQPLKSKSWKCFFFFFVKESKFRLSHIPKTTWGLIHYSFKIFWKAEG